jgi:hypothetical protein
MYEFVTAGNGVFLQARSRAWQVTLPLVWAHIRGLAQLAPAVRLAGGVVPRELLREMWRRAEEAAGEPRRGVPPREILFYLLAGETGGWQLVEPPQMQSGGSVRPLDDGPESAYAQAVIEVHSHHRHPPRFSEWDDRDEQGFRLYGVLGYLGRADKRPTLRLRVGVYGHFCEIPASLAFELPQGLADAVQEENPGQHWQGQATGREGE